MPAKADATPCRRCGEAHDVVACPFVKAVEYDDLTGTIRRLEFLTPADYPSIKEIKVEPPEADYPKLKAGG